MELNDSTLRAQRSALALQRKLGAILRSYGIGADPHSTGLKRDMPNWKNPAKLIDINHRRREEVESQRLRVVSELLNAVSRHPAVYVKRSEHPERFLATDSRSEKGLAKLYEHLLGEFSDPCLSFGQLLELTVRKVYAQNFWKKL